jgi:GT2 family glycosyltransferase
MVMASPTWTAANWWHSSTAMDEQRRSLRSDLRRDSLASCSRATRWSSVREKPQIGDDWINVGFFMLEPRILDYIDGDATLFEREPLERLGVAGQLVANRHEAPASAGGDAMRISIVVPAYNNAGDLLECLAALSRSAPADSEILVVDDASTDDTSARTEAAGFRVLRRSANGGPGAARNDGARAARGQILLFVDADVVVAPDAIDRVLRAFAADAQLAALFGSYDIGPRDPGVISRYWNLRHHFVHQHGNPNASTFWAGCGAIRRAVFEAIGGFDVARFPRPSIEDVELGYRLRAAGYRIRLDKDLQATHLKRWTFFSVLRTDINQRAIPWARLVMESGAVLDDLNLKWGQRLSAILAALVGFFLVLGVFRAWFLGPAIGAAITVLVLNRQLYALFFRQYGLRFMAECIPLHFLYFLYSGLSYVLVWGVFRLQRHDRHARRSRGPKPLPSPGRSESDRGSRP